MILADPEAIHHFSAKILFKILSIYGNFCPPGTEFDDISSRDCATGRRNTKHY